MVDPHLPHGEALPPHPGTVAPDPRIASDEALGPAVRRICLEHLDQACAALSAPEEGRDEGIHTARKAIKRIRAMARLVREAVGEQAYGDQDGALRQAARLIAPARDELVGVLTMDRILERYRGSLPPAVFAGVRERLAERHRRTVAAVVDDPQGVLDAIVTLRTVRHRFAAWPVEGDDPEGAPESFDSIAPGIRLVYRQGCRRMRAAYQEGSEAAFHRWRRPVKYLRHQLEALEPIWPPVVGGLARTLDHLGEILGEEHDFTLLRGMIDDDPDLVGDGAERHLLEVLIREQQERLRRAARLPAELAFAEPPAEFVRRIGSYWSAARRR